MFCGIAVQVVNAQRALALGERAGGIRVGAAGIEAATRAAAGLPAAGGANATTVLGPLTPALVGGMRLVVGRPHAAAAIVRCRVFAFTRTGDAQGQAFARSLGAVWAGSSEDRPPEPLDAAIIFAPVGALVPAALQAVRKGGRMVCGGIHMSDIPPFPYGLLWGERQLISVANLTREDAAEFFRFVARFPLKVQTEIYRLEDANLALSDLRAGRIQGAAVLVP